MKRSRFIVLVGSLCLVVALLFVSACGPKAKEPTDGDGVVKVTPETIVWNAITFSASSNEGAKDWVTYVIDEINERVARKYPGEFYINYRGGVEVIGYGEQAAAVRGGVIEMLHASAGHYRDAVPHAQAMKVTQYTPEEQRASGAFDMMWDKHMKAGLVYLGRHCFGSQHLITLKEYETPYDFKGLKFVCPTGYVKALQALGIVTTVLPVEERYGALERRVVVGTTKTFEILSIEGTELEICKYAYDHGFAICSIVGVANLPAWNKLPSHIQTLILEVSHEAEAKIEASTNARNEIGRRLFIESGGKFITFSDADAKWYVETIENAIWEADVKPYVPAADYAQLRQVFGW